VGLEGDWQVDWSADTGELVSYVRNRAGAHPNRGVAYWRERGAHGRRLDLTIARFLGEISTRSVEG